MTFTVLKMVSDWAMDRIQTSSGIGKEYKKALVELFQAIEKVKKFH